MTTDEKIKIMESLAKSGLSVDQFILENTGTVCYNDNRGKEARLQHVRAENAVIVEDLSQRAVCLPEQLSTAVAMKYWRRLQAEGFVDESYSILNNVSRRQVMYIAELFSEKLGLPSKWKPFEQLWGLSNLAQEKWAMQQAGVLPPRYKDIDSIFSD